MKYVTLLVLLFLLAEQVSATQITYTDVFGECPVNASTFECMIRFFIPSLHLHSLNVFVWSSIWNIAPFTSEPASKFYDEGMNLLFNISSIFSGGALEFALGVYSLIVTFFTDILLGIVDYILGVISGIIVYLIVLGFEFVKNYLFLSVVWLAWTTVFEQVFGIKSGYPVIGLMTVTVFLMLVGSIYILTLDWGNTITAVIG